MSNFPLFLKMFHYKLFEEKLAYLCLCRKHMYWMWKHCWMIHDYGTWTLLNNRYCIKGPPDHGKEEITFCSYWGHYNT